MMSSNELQRQWASSYLSGGSMDYVDGLYEDYLLDPNSVSADWRQLFDGMIQQQGGVKEVPHREVIQYFLNNERKSKPVVQISQDGRQYQVLQLIDAYRAQGHYVAQIDPLAMTPRHEIPALDMAQYHITSADLSQAFSSGGYLSADPIPLKDILTALKQTYCGSIGAEIMHLTDPREKEWFESKLESVRGKPSLNGDAQRAILHDLIAADGLERYLGTRFVGQKRFSLEGGDALIPMMKSIVRQAGQSHVKEVVVGMAHRGRLNVLVNVLGKKPEKLFEEFEGKASYGDISGDVKYHLGFSSNVQTESGEIVHLALAFNPSHLEIISPVVEGSVRSRLGRRHNLDKKDQVLPVVIHGDAAFAGQGVVMETFNFSQARGYCTGGTVHIVINNQIGFTTSNPLDARSTYYCTDVAKMIQAPVLHVNGDDPEAVVFVAQLAFEFRMKFKRDVVIDLVCYRRHGHNEADEPSITQPDMYRKIKTMRPLREKYAEQLIQAGLMTAEEVDAQVEAYRMSLDAGQAVVPTFHGDYAGKLANDWGPYLHAKWTDIATTSVSLQTIKKLATQLTTLPQGFSLHPVVKRLLAERDKMTAGELPMNWGYAETLAYATLLAEGTEVRLSGQDCGRGTFAHRHAVLYDTETGESITPLRALALDQHKSFEVIDSVLSEEAVLAFEYGFAASEPTALVLWEAQFGDFANGAQVVIDQFISSGEQKWGRLCGLVMLLPHGYEGQGPEHSSARLERYMQLCAQQNIQVCTPTTPAQIFHLLRRQVIRNFRKPLIIMTPKSILRHKLAVSELSDLTDGKFYNVIPEVDVLDSAQVTKVVLCCGKVYYDLLQKRRDEGLKNTAIVRIEQLYPFPADELKEVMAQYPKVKQVVWCQEEPKNQGAWFATWHHIKDCIKPDQKLSYAGREFAAAPAAGSASLHAKQQEALVNEAIMN